MKLFPEIPSRTSAPWSYVPDYRYWTRCVEMGGFQLLRLTATEAKSGRWEVRMDLETFNRGESWFFLAVSEAAGTADAAKEWLDGRAAMMKAWSDQREDFPAAAARRPSAAIG